MSAVPWVKLFSKDNVAALCQVHYFHVETTIDGPCGISFHNSESCYMNFLIFCFLNLVILPYHIAVLVMEGLIILVNMSSIHTYMQMHFLVLLCVEI